MAFTSWDGSAVNTSYVPADQTPAAQWAKLAASMAPQPQRLATGLGAGGQGSGPAFGGTGGSAASNASNSSNSSNSLSSYLSNLPAVPTLQTAQRPTMPTYNASTSSTPSPYASQIQQLMAQLQAQASQSDSALTDRVNQQIAAQRGVLDRRANDDVTRSLAQNGLLAAGGQAARMRQQISLPYEEMLAANAAQLNGTLSSQRTATQNNLMQSLASLQNADRGAAAEAQRLQMEAQRLDYQAQMNQYDMAMRANETAYQRAMDQYQIQQQQRAQQAAASQAAQQTAARAAQVGGGSGGGGTVYGPSINAGSNSFLESGVQPRDLYNQGLAADRANQQRQYDMAMADRQNRQRAGLDGNGVSSAGSYTGISMNGPLVSGSYQASSPTNYGGYGTSGYNSGGGSYTPGQNGYATEAYGNNFFSGVGG